MSNRAMPAAVLQSGRAYIRDGSDSSSSKIRLADATADGVIVDQSRPVHTVS